MGQVFISYRRDDAGGHAERLTQAIAQSFGPASVVRDAGGVAPDMDRARRVQQAVDAAVAVLVVIGPRWAAGAGGARPLDATDDPVRQDLQAALGSAKPVIPVLVGGATIPSQSELPAPLRALTRLQTVVLSEAAWDTDLQPLLGALAPLLALPELPRRRGWRKRWVAAAALVLVGLGASAYMALLRNPDIAGRWEAEVHYEGGTRYRETFIFHRVGDEWQGSASFLGQPRSIDRLRLDGPELLFETHGAEPVGGDEKRELRHFYRGEVDDDHIRFQLASRGGTAAGVPISFEARRLP